MSDYLEDGARLLPGLQAGKVAFADFFRARTARWKYWHYDVECGGIDMGADLEKALDARRSAELVPEAAEVARVQKDPHRFATALWLLLTLARNGRTRAVPPRLGSLRDKAAAYPDNTDVQFLWEKVRAHFRFR